MYIYLSKILPLLVLPASVVLGAMLLALVLAWRGARKVSIGFLALAIMVLWAGSMPFLARALYGRLEAEFPPANMAAIPDSRCIVLLGGALGPPLPPRVDTDLTEAADRVYKAAQLYRAGKGQRIFVAAGNQPWAGAQPVEAALIGELLVEWGVPAQAIVPEGASRNTRENALNLKPLLNSAACGRSLLVTSAAHMPRAYATFRAVGLAVHPVATDVRVIRPHRVTVFDFLPDADALAMTSDALREWMGRKVYEWRSWN